MDREQFVLTIGMPGRRHLSGVCVWLLRLTLFYNVPYTLGTSYSPAPIGPYIDFYKPGVGASETRQIN